VIRRQPLILKAALIGVAIELLPAVWLRGTVERVHQSIIPVILAVVHLPSIALAVLLLLPVKSRMSEATFEAVSWPLAFIIQASIIGVIAFLFLCRREKRRGDNKHPR
jgi:hypothetical protein